MYLKIVIVSILLFVHIIDGRVPWRKGTLEEKPIQAIFDALPEEEKSAFISYFLMKHYWSTSVESLHDDMAILEYPFMPELYRKFEELNIAKEFPRVLTEWVMTDYHVETEQIPLLALGSTVCPPELENCIDIGDLGPNCCPM
ncbi:uncharacterized protein LOC123296475 [Chrysoperla carnea]|uniref:uncharacterized protein LOC123296475 n=1 Tax=Chrysoperla carnea TaxID=189513 RepID=UPI001D087A7E|nr:uncharacterized protein LOC123296475 [Chrysoperla carnea]